MNGYIWVGKPRKPIAELDLDAVYSSEVQPVAAEEREAIVRTCKALKLLNVLFRTIDEEAIKKMYEKIESIPLSQLASYVPDQ